jgi:hypothetical protein
LEVNLAARLLHDECGDEASVTAATSIAINIESEDRST